MSRRSIQKERKWVLSSDFAGPKEAIPSYDFKFLLRWGVISGRGKAPRTILHVHCWEVFKKR